MDNHNEVEQTEEIQKTTLQSIGTDFSFKRQIVWKNAIGFLVLHLLALYGLYLCFYARGLTIFWMLLIALLSGEGVTIGAHRMYSHKSFKGTFGLRLVLVILQTMAGQVQFEIILKSTEVNCHPKLQNCLYIWVRDHRQHHKYSDTDADPHNATRGFFFSHIGWLMTRKHPEVISKGKGIDMSDLENDSVVMFQKKYYKSLYTILAIMIPVAVPVYFWNESLILSFFTVYLLRYILVLHTTWSVNSVAHLYGTKPFDKYILPVESHFVSFIGIGEGWHNYHHTFPWDYRAAELGSKYNLTAKFIDALHWLNLAYDLKVAPYALIETRSVRTGDGTHPIFGNQRKIPNQPVFDDLKERPNQKKKSSVIIRNKAARG